MSRLLPEPIKDTGQPNVPSDELNELLRIAKPEHVRKVAILLHGFHTGLLPLEDFPERSAEDDQGHAWLDAIDRLLCDRGVVASYDALWT